MSKQGGYVRRAENRIRDEEQAVAALARDLAQATMEGVIFFCSFDYDRDRLAAALRKHFSCPVIGCTTAGEIASTYQQGGIVGVSFSSGFFGFHPMLITPLDKFTPLEAKNGIAELTTQLKFSSALDAAKMFGFLLIDGSQMKEEQVAASLHGRLDGVAMVGGTAGDNLIFRETYVYVDGAFHTNAAVFALIETILPFRTFKFQHYSPSDKDLVITEADPLRRMVLEINGGPAAEELANIIGIKKEELTLEVYSTHPLMLQIGDDWYVRSIQRYNDNDSLTFACAIDSGLPLTLGKATGIVETLRGDVDKLKQCLPDIVLTLGCDCVHRRLEIIETKIHREVEGILADLNFIGFSTYGEQFNAIHINQTLTGIAIGAPLEA